jgi:predicted TIM-barrel fold metal-dependent hydrolase
VKFDELDRILTAHPRLRLVLRGANLGSDRDLCGLARAHDGFLVDTADYKPLFGIEGFARAFGARRLLFGSGWPVQNLGGSAAPLLLSTLSEREKADVAGGNLLRLLEEVRYV